MKQYVYYAGYSHKRGFGAVWFNGYGIKDFDDLNKLTDWIKKYIVENNKSITYEEIVILSLSQIPLSPKKEGFFKKVFRAIIGGIK